MCFWQTRLNILLKKGGNFYKTDHIHSYYDLSNSKFIKILSSINKISSLHLRQSDFNRYRKISGRKYCLNLKLTATFGVFPGVVTYKKKGKVTLVQALRLCTGRMAHRGSRGTALSWPTALEWGDGSASRPGHSLPSGKALYPLYRRLVGSQGRSEQVRKISPPTGIWYPDLPARSQSLYRLRYPAHTGYLSSTLNVLY
jgi:hypothetical protein